MEACLVSWPDGAADVPHKDLAVLLVWFGVACACTKWPGEGLPPGQSGGQCRETAHSQKLGGTFSGAGEKMEIEALAHPARGLSLILNSPLSTPPSRPMNSTRVVQALGTIVGLLILGYLATQWSHVLFTVFAGVLLAVFLAGGSRVIEAQTALPRPWALLIMLLSLLGVGVGLWAVAGPDISEQASGLAALLPDAADRLEARVRASAERYAWLRPFVDPSQLLPPVSSVLGRVTNVFRGTLTIVADVFIVLFIGIYGAAAPTSYLNSMVRLVPPDRRSRAREVLYALGRALRWWLVGRLLMMVIVGVLTGLGLYVLGIPSPVALGLVAGLFSFVPYLGPVLSVVPALLVASVVGGTEMIYVLGVYGAVQLLESYLIAPLVQQQAVHIPPAAVITAQFIGGISAGAVGVLLATPLTIVAIVLVQMLYVEDVLGDQVPLLGEH